MTLLVFLMILGAGEAPIDDNALSGQAHHTATKEASSNYNSSPAWHADDTEEIVDELSSELQETEEEILIEEESLLKKAVAAGGKALRAGIWKVLGSGASSEEVEEIAKEVEAELESQVLDELEVQAEDVLEEALDAVSEEVMEEEEYSNKDRAAIRTSVMSKKDVYGSDIRKRIKNVEGDLQSKLNDRSLDLEKKILEQKLSKQYGRDIHLEVKAGELRNPDLGTGGSSKKKSETTPSYGTANGYGGGTSGTSGYGGTSGGNGGPSTTKSSTGYGTTSTYGGTSTSATGYGTTSSTGGGTRGYANTQSSYGQTTTKRAAADDDANQDDDDGTAPQKQSGGASNDDNDEYDDDHKDVSFYNVLGTLYVELLSDFTSSFIARTIPPTMTTPDRH